MACLLSSCDDTDSDSSSKDYDEQRAQQLPGQQTFINKISQQLSGQLAFNKTPQQLPGQQALNRPAQQLPGQQTLVNKPSQKVTVSRKHTFKISQPPAEPVPPNHQTLTKTKPLPDIPVPKVVMKTISQNENSKSAKLSDARVTNQSKPNPPRRESSLSSSDTKKV